MINFLKSGLFLLIVLIWFVALLLILLRKFIAMNRLQKIDKKNAEYFNNIYYGTRGLREEDNKFITQIVTEKKEIEDQNLYFDNIAFPYDELVEMRRLGRHHCTVPPYFVSVQRPYSYKEDKPDEI